MKTAVYVRDGEAQLVLTPESEFEKAIVDKIAPRQWTGGSYEVKPCEATFYRGSFYECRGGWFRHGSEDDSLMVRFKQQVPLPEFVSDVG